MRLSRQEITMGRCKTKAIQADLVITHIRVNQAY